MASLSNLGPEAPYTQSSSFLIYPPSDHFILFAEKYWNRDIISKYEEEGKDQNLTLLQKPKREYVLQP